jgi:hypothetical protein
MRKVLLWFGVTLYVVGVALILANVVMSYLGLVARFNFGDLTQFQVLASYWHLGLAIAVVGGMCLVIRRGMSGDTRQSAP